MDDTEKYSGVKCNEVKQSEVTQVWNPVGSLFFIISICDEK